MFYNVTQTWYETKILKKTLEVKIWIFKIWICQSGNTKYTSEAIAMSTKLKNEVKLKLSPSSSSPSSLPSVSSIHL